MSEHLHGSTLTIMSKSSMQHALLHIKVLGDTGRLPFRSNKLPMIVNVPDRYKAQERADTMRAALFHIGRNPDFAISDTHLNQGLLPSPSFRFDTTQIL